MTTLLLALWWSPPAEAAGCRGAIRDALSAWRDLQIPVPMSADGVGPVQDTLALVAGHGAIEGELAKARRRSARVDLAGTVDRAKSWLADHPELRNGDAARVALEQIGPVCTP